MKNYRVSGLTPFVPAIALDTSLAFYRELGFEELSREPKMVLLSASGFGFWLQDYYVKEWAENCMLCLYVENLSDWWARVTDMRLGASPFGEARVLAEPHEQSGGSMFQLSDPAGVLWHVRQKI